MSYERKSDKMIEEVNKKLDRILEILNGNGKIGLCAQVEINRQSIDNIKKRPARWREWVIAGAIIINTVVAAIAIMK